MSTTSASRRTLKNTLAILGVIAVIFFASGNLVSHMTMKMSPGTNCPTCQNVRGEILGFLVSQDFLKSVVLIMSSALLVSFLGRKSIRLLLLSLQRRLYRSPPRTETFAFFDTAFRQLRQFQIFANAVPDPQVVSA